MAELNGQVFGAWVSYRNWAIKPGVQIPVYNNIGRDNPTPRLNFAVEIHI